MEYSTNNTLHPTYTGHIASTMDSLILFEACLSGRVTRLHRRPNKHERASLIKSGNVFIYDECASGMKRWTDGISWSPSRVLGNFLIYRELDGALTPLEKKIIARKKKNHQRAMKSDGASSSAMSYPSAMGSSNFNDTIQRTLVGSLLDSYRFKEDGLIKKTATISYQGITYHMISYYTVEDVTAGHLCTPTNHHTLGYVTPRPKLMSQNFRAPIDMIDYENGGKSVYCEFWTPFQHPDGIDYHERYNSAFPSPLSSVWGPPSGVLRTYLPSHTPMLSARTASNPIQSIAILTGTAGRNGILFRIAENDYSFPEPEI